MYIYFHDGVSTCYIIYRVCTNLHAMRCEQKIQKSDRKSNLEGIFCFLAVVLFDDQKEKFLHTHIQINTIDNNCDEFLLQNW